ncbi:MAG: hypothetical protein KGO96_06970 [Elusimicrobia bacterium]|nr:hypothetical protein [Elusimicrobiota bacterium]
MKIARRSKHKNFYHAALLIRSGNIVGMSYNHDLRHAEIGALNQCWPSERRGCTLISIRITKGNKLASAKPCPDCLSALKENGIKKVFYSTAERTIEEIRI